MIDVYALVEVYRVCKEYIPVKERQVVADHIVNSLSEHDLSDSDYKAIAQTDKFLKHAIEQYFGEDLDIGHDDESDDDY